MKYFLQLFVAILFMSLGAKAQWVPITHTAGTVTYGTISCTVTSTGGVGTWSGCLGGGEYWIGRGTSGGYTYTFSRPIYGIRLQGWALNTGEHIYSNINGASRPFTTADITSYTSCASSGGPVVLTGGNIYGPTGSGHNGPHLLMRHSAPINNFLFYCVTNSGMTYLVQVDTTNPFGAIANTPCQGDSLKLSMNDSSSSGVTYSWTGPGGFTSTLRDAFRYPATFADSGDYVVTRTYSGVSFIDTIHVTVKQSPNLVVTATSPVCLGDSINLRAGPLFTGETFSWTGPGSFTSTLQNVGIGGATIADSGLYTVIADIDGCSDTVSANVRVISVSVPTATNNSPICSGGALMLYGSSSTAGVRYSWSGPGGFTNTNQNVMVPGVTTASTGIYTLTTSIGSCTQTDTTEVTILPNPPIPTIPSILPICSGQTLYLSCTDTAGATYFWQGPNGFTSTMQNPTITNAPVIATGTYTVTATLNGCSASRTVFITVNLTPEVPSVSSNSPLCSGDTMLLFSSSTTAGVRYNWSGPASYSAVGANQSVPNIQTYHSGNYTVTATLGNCSSSASVTVVVNPTPTMPVLSTNAPVCSGGLLTLNAFVIPGTGVYYWSGPLGFTSSVSNPSIFPVAMGAAGRYSVYEIVDGCVSPTASINITINLTPLPPMVATNAPICQGDTLLLMADDSTAGVTYSWAGPAGFSSVLQNPIIYSITPTQAGVYTVTAHLGPCSSSNIIDVVVTSTPSLVTSTNSPLCSGDSLKLRATSAAGNTFLWVGPYSFRSIANNIDRIPALVEYSGIYTVTVTEPGGCFNTKYETVRVKPTPTNTWLNYINYCQYYSAPPLHPIDARNVLWYTSGASGSTGSTTAPVPNTSIPGIYFYYLNQTVEGCSSPIDSIQVVVYPKPEVSLTQSDDAICPHDEITLTATRTDSFSYVRWKPWLYLDDTTKDVVKAKPITNIKYMVVSYNRYGCTDTASANEITVYPAGVISLGVTDSVMVYPGESIHIQPSSNCISFNWFPNIDVSNVSVADPVITPNTSTKYYVKGLTQFGCEAMDSVYFSFSKENLYGVPNAFTPGSGVNNEFKLQARGIAQLNYFRIYNRWGNLLFETKDLNIGWDGSFNGAPQPLGVYVYEIQAVSSVTGKLFNKRGNVTLLR